MKTCKQCGAVLDDGAVFCHECGYSPDGPTAILVKKSNSRPKALYLIPLLTVALYFLVEIVYSIVFVNQIVNVEYRAQSFYYNFSYALRDAAILAVLPVVFWDMYRKNASKGAHTLIAILAIVFFALQCGAAGIIQGAQADDSDISEVVYLWSDFFPGSWLLVQLKMMTEYLAESESAAYLILSAATEEIAFLPTLSLIVCGFIGAAKASPKGVKVRTISAKNVPAPAVYPQNTGFESGNVPAYAANPKNPTAPSFAQTPDAPWSNPAYAPTVPNYHDADESQSNAPVPSFSEPSAPEIGQTAVLNESFPAWEASPVASAPYANNAATPHQPNVAQQPISRFCTGCGAELPDSALFCHCCGKKR